MRSTPSVRLEPRPSRWPAGLEVLTALALLAALGVLLPPTVAAGIGVWVAIAAWRWRRRLTRRLAAAATPEPLRLSADPDGLRLAIGAAPPVPLRDAWRIGGLDVLYPAAGTPQLLWPDSLLPADRARMRALLTLNPCSSR